MPRTPNYDFERREREKAKAAKKAEKAQAKRERRPVEGEDPDAGAKAQQVLSEMDVAIAEDKSRQT